jgi:predicted dehydrogenase
MSNAQSVEPLRVAIVAQTNSHTRKYYQTLQGDPRLRWLAAHAETPEIAARFEAQGFGVPCYDTLDAMLVAHSELEAVILASSNERHLEQVLWAAEHGLHMLSMKIPTFDPREYDRMIEAVDAAGVICQVELELHYNPVVHRVKQAVGDGTLGRLHAIQMTNTTLCPVWAFPWQGDPRRAYGRRQPLRDGESRCRGGALADHPHPFDMLRWLTGSDFAQLYAQLAPNLRPDVELEDMILVAGHMLDGTSFLIDPSWSRMEERIETPGPGWERFPKRMEVELAVVGEQATLLADCFGPNIYHNGAPNDRYTVHYTYFDEWVGLIDEFVRCVRTASQPRINLRWHRRTIDVMNACYESVEKGRPIDVTPTE